MINDDRVILDLFRDDLLGNGACAVYGRVYERDAGGGWERQPSLYRPAAMLSVLGADGDWVPLVEERDLLTHMARAIVRVRR